MKHQVLFSQKNNGKVFMNVICCSRDWCFKDLDLQAKQTKSGSKQASFFFLLLHFLFFFFLSFIFIFLKTKKKKEVRSLILSTGIDRSEQTMKTQIRLLPQEQSDQVRYYLSFHLHLMDALVHCKMDIKGESPYKIYN